MSNFRVAVVIHGLVGGVGGRNGLGQPTDLDVCARLIYKHVVIPNKADVFLHSWSEEYRSALIEHYLPTRYIVEPQEMFGFPESHNKNGNDESTEMFRVISRYASLAKAVALKSEYEKSNGIVYDRVVVIRPDLVFFKRLDVSGTDSDCLYICHEPQYDLWNTNIHAAGICHDVLFVSNSELSDRLAETYKLLMDGSLNDLLKEWERVGIPHRLIYHRLSTIVSKEKIIPIVRRYDDVEIYRFVVRPDTNPFSCYHGGHMLQDRMIQEMKNV